jgi:streptogramin lyase
MGPLRTVSQVSFTEDSTQLIAFVKGNPPANVTGFMSVYPVQPDGLVSQTEIQSNPNGTAVLFGSIQIPGTPRWVATDASLGGALLEVNPSTGVASTIALSPIPDQNATCWATYSASTDTVYVTDINENRLVGIDPATGELDMNVVALDNGSKGMIDLVAAGDFVYALSVGGERATIVVLDLSDGKDGVKFTQNFQPEGMIDVLKVQGLALCE